MSEPNPWIAIASDQLSAEIDPHGAQLSRLTTESKEELLWNGDPAVWAGRAPLLFPIVGVLVNGCYRLGANTYRLPRHGFARNRLFRVVSRSPSSTRLQLDSDAQTLENYPFAFSLEVEFHVAGPSLSVTTSIRNQGDGMLYASFGYHPALRWPLPFGQPRSSHFIEFESEEDAPVRRIDAEGLLISKVVATPVIARRLRLSDELFSEDVVIFDRLRSRAVIYGAERGRRIRVDFPEARYLGIWSKPGAEFVCIEPWNGVTDPEGYNGEFSSKPGVFPVARGGQFLSSLIITVAG